MVPQQLSQHTHPTQDRSPEGCRLLYGRVATVRGFRVARILPVLLTPSFLFESVPRTHPSQDRGPEGCRLPCGRVAIVLSFRVVARILPVRSL